MSSANQSSSLLNQVNNVLISQQKKVIFLPGYIRLNLLNFISMDIAGLDTQIQAKIFLTLSYKNIHQINQQQLVDHLSQKLILKFQKQQPLILTSTQQQDDNIRIKIKNDQQKQQINFIIQKNIKCRMQPKIFLTPFQLIHNIFLIKIQHTKIDNYLLKVNLMEYKDNLFQIKYDNNTAFGNYNLAQYYTRCIISDHQIYEIQDKIKKTQQVYNKEQIDLYKIYQQKKLSNKKLFTQYQEYEKQKWIKQNRIDIESYHYCYFNLPVYKFPLASITNIIIPLLLLGIISIGIYHQNTTLADRIGSISILFIAFVTLIPVIRSNMPPTSSLVFPEVLVISQFLSCIFVFIDSMQIRLEDPSTYNLNPKTNALYILSIIIQAINLIVYVLLITVHHKKWQPQYNTQIITKQKQKQKNDFTKWNNSVFDQKFKRVNRNKNLVLKVLQKIQNSSKTISNKVKNGSNNNPRKIRKEK